MYQTLLRLFPFAGKTGLIRIGHPGRDAPVLLTCNFRLTVARVQRALEGLNAYLLVANSRGVNVWCGATGGLLTNHDVVSVLKTSGIDRLVDHRNLILPQLAATGVEARVVHEKTGWCAIWGPVEASAIPEFLAEGLRATPEMRTVRFPWPRRIEMAVAWAFPISLLALVVLPFWAAGFLPLVSMAWAWSILIFLTFPLFAPRPRSQRKYLRFLVLDLGPRSAPLILWGLFLGTLIAYTAAQDLPWLFAVRWAVASLVVVLLLTIDLVGSTPVCKSGLHDDRLLQIALDEERCQGPGSCEEVCPVGVFEVDRVQQAATLPNRDRCVKCGACIVQCPCDALYFVNPGGDVIPPETVRRFKLNLLGKRVVRPVS